MSLQSSASAPVSGVPWADPPTPLESALTDCCLSYKHHAPVSPLFAALTNTSHPIESAHFETLCFDTLARSCALPKKPSPLQSDKSSLFLQNTRGGCTPTQHRRFAPPTIFRAFLDPASAPPLSCFSIPPRL